MLTMIPCYIKILIKYKNKLIKTIRTIPNNVTSIQGIKYLK